MENDHLIKSIATHSLKFLNARTQQMPIRTALKSAPEGTVNSSTVTCRKRLWAAPNNAADMKKVKALIDKHSNSDLNDFVPDLTCHLSKQVLVPTDNWLNDDYISVTPATSLSLLNELSARLKEQEHIKRTVRTIQPNPSAWANHGELAVENKGKVSLLRRGVKTNKVDSSYCDESVFEFSFYVEAMNITSGMLSLGLPAIAGVGGFVHTLERAISKDLTFAIGVKSIHWNKGIPRTTRISGSRKNPKVSPDFDASERTAHAEIVLLIQRNDLTATQIEKFRTALQSKRSF